MSIRDTAQAVPFTCGGVGGDTASGELRDPSLQFWGSLGGFGGVTHSVGMAQPAPLPAVHDIQPPALVIGAVGSTGNLGDGGREGSGGFGHPPPPLQRPPKMGVLIRWQGQG